MYVAVRRYIGAHILNEACIVAYLGFFFTVEKFNFLIDSISDGVSCCSPVLCFTVGFEVDIVGFELFDLAHLIEPYRHVGLE